MTNTDIISSWQSKHVLVLGDLMVDQYLWGDSTRISPEAPVPVVDVSERELRPGGAANAALNLKALGARVSLCGLVGMDEEGTRLISYFKTHDFQSDGIIRSTKRRTTIKTRIMARGQQLMRVDEEDRFNLDSDERASIEAFFNEMPNVDAILISDYDKGLLDHALIHHITQYALDHNILVSVDPKFKQFFDYSACTLFKPNLRELNEALGLHLSGKQHESIKKAVMNLRTNMPHDLSLITLGKDGMLTIDESGSITHIPAKLREVVDVSGAGDTTIAVATLALCAGASLPEAAILANEAAGLACDIAGVAPVSKEMLLEHV